MECFFTRALINSPLHPPHYIAVVMEHTTASFPLALQQHRHPHCVPGKHLHGNHMSSKVKDAGHLNETSSSHNPSQDYILVMWIHLEQYVLPQYIFCSICIFFFFYMKSFGHMLHFACIYSLKSINLHNTSANGFSLTSEHNILRIFKNTWIAQ